MRRVATAETYGYEIRAPIAKPVTARSADPSARGTGMMAQKDTGAADNYISCARDAGRARGGGNGRPAAMTMQGRFFGSQKLCFFAGPAAAHRLAPPATLCKTIN